MAVSNLNFAAQIDNWVKQTEQRMTAVFRESSQEVSAAITANLSGTLVKVDTGFLRKSQRASTKAMPPIDKNAVPKEGQSYAFNQGEIALVIAGAGLGETIYLGMTAAYAPYLEYGTSKIAPRGYIGSAALQWQGIVNRVAAQAKSRAGRT